MRYLCAVCTVILLFSAALPIAVQAQDEKPLPRVLIIGDAVYDHNLKVGLTADIKDRAEVVVARYPAGIVLNSSTAIEHLDQLLGRIDRNSKAVAQEKWPKWDLILFNVGLGDLIHSVPELKSLRVLPIHAGGMKVTDAKEYAKNLDTLVRQLKASVKGTKLVWASTTPIRASSSNVFEKGSEIAYNEIAAAVIAKHGVPTCDMHSYVKCLINMDKPAGHGADPFHFDKLPIHMPIVRAIETAFGFTPMPETKEEKTVKQIAGKKADANPGP